MHKLVKMAFTCSLLVDDRFVVRKTHVLFIHSRKIYLSKADEEELIVCQIKTR